MSFEGRYLQGRALDRRDVLSIGSFPKYQQPRPGPEPIQELSTESRSPTWVSDTQALNQHLVLPQLNKKEAGSESEQVGLEPGSLIWDISVLRNAINLSQCLCSSPIYPSHT